MFKGVFYFFRFSVAVSFKVGSGTRFSKIFDDVNFIRPNNKKTSKNTSF